MDPLNALGPGLDVGKSIWRRATYWINSVRKLEYNTSVMTVRNQQLTAKEMDIKKEIKRASDEGKEPSNVVLRLLEDVKNVNHEINGITLSLEDNGRCFFDCCSRLKLAKRVDLAMGEVDRILKEISQFPTDLAVDLSPPIALTLPAPSLVGKSTVQRNVDAIMESLRDPEINKIGVYAMGGSGKTTTMLKINNLLGKTTDFNQVFWVTVSKELDIDKVQTEIARQLDLNLSSYTEEVPRAGRLFERLNHLNKFLIIFDDMWDRIPLEKVGIPEPNEGNQCKIVLTTRSLGVCNSMETDKDIKLNLLTKDEALELFVSKAGKEVLSSEVKPFAQQVVQECGGLPLAINTVGRALRREVNVRVWRQALQDLKSSPSEIRGMEDDVFNLLRLSYKRLQNDTVRKCFLYAALFPEDYAIMVDQLISYWIADNLITEKASMQTEVDEGYKILKELVDACMFEKVENHRIYIDRFKKDAALFEWIRLHDTIRDLAIKIMREDGGLLLKSGLGITESPKKNEWDNAIKVSLTSNKLEELQNQPSCPNLSILLLSSNPLRDIVPTFFVLMPSLQVLDLSDTEVGELPSSLSLLVNLRALYLRQCLRLKGIPSLSKLERLQVLDLSSTDIKELPQGLEGLISLRSLDISYTKNLENCAISKLSHLEEFFSHESKVFWVMDSPAVIKCMEEMGPFNRLAMLTLSMRLDDYLIAFMCLRWELLTNFHIKIHAPLNVSETIESKSVHIFEQQIVNHVATLLLPPNTEKLLIHGCTIPRLSQLVCIRNMTYLKKLQVKNCSLMSTGEFVLFGMSLDCLILGDEMEGYAFPSLEYWEVYDVRGATSLWQGLVPPACLGNLRVLDVGNCVFLKNLFSIHLLQNLESIEVIKVLNCTRMEDMVVGSNITTVVLPRLHSLTLASLPELQCLSTAMLVCPLLRNLKVLKCQKVKNLPFSVETLSNLQNIEGNIEWWDAMQWEDAQTRNLLNPKFKEITY